MCRASMGMRSNWKERRLLKRRLGPFRIKNPARN
jgi:hypothetical protein